MRKISLNIILLLITINSIAQDVHFSQFFAAPLLSNPANTGSFTGSWRIGLNYRDQWGSITTPYKTYDLYTDLAIQPNKAKNRFGIGLLALNDIAGDGILTTSRIQSSAAYHIGYDKNATVRFSMGISGAFVQKKINMQLLTFDSQWNIDEFNTGIPNNENPTSDVIQYYDFSAGAMLTFLPYDGEKYFVHAAMHHVNKPEESFFDDGNTLHMKLTSGLGASFLIGTNTTLQPQLHFNKQSSAYEFILGSNMAMKLDYYNADKYRAIIFGTWYRWKDAAWLVAGVNFGNITCSVNYDFNLSKLTPSTNGLGGLELALVYTMRRQIKHTGIECPLYE